MSVVSLVHSGPLLLAIPVAAAAGAVTFLSPCCLPLVPGYLAYITGMSGADASTDGGAAVRRDRRRPERGGSRGRRRGHHPRQNLGRRAGRRAPRPGGRGGGAVRPRLLGRVLADRPGGRRGRGAAAVAHGRDHPGARRGDDPARACCSSARSTGSCSPAGSSSRPSRPGPGWRARRCSASCSASAGRPASAPRSARCWRCPLQSGTAARGAFLCLHLRPRPGHPVPPRRGRSSSAW